MTSTTISPSQTPPPPLTSSVNWFYCASTSLPAPPFTVGFTSSKFQACGGRQPPVTQAQTSPPLSLIDVICEWSLIHSLIPNRVKFRTHYAMPRYAEGFEVCAHFWIGYLFLLNIKFTQWVPSVTLFVTTAFSQSVTNVAWNTSLLSSILLEE